MSSAIGIKTDGFRRVATASASNPRLYSGEAPGGLQEEDH